MYAIISDIHSNIEALSEVFKRIDGERVDNVICLGDVIGYGPDPDECVDIIRSRCKFTIRGNHDDALMGDAVDFNAIAREVIDGTRHLMRPNFFSSRDKKARWEFLKRLEERREMVGGEVLYVHGSPRDPIKEYVMPHWVMYSPEKLQDVFSQIKHVCFVGHTHLPGVFVERREGGRPVYEHYSPSELGKNGEFTIGEEKILVNVGSVGQPRDQDPRSCFVFVEEDDQGRPTKIRFERVEYDIRKVQSKIYDIPWINNLCGTRLEMGK